MAFWESYFIKYTYLLFTFPFSLSQINFCVTFVLYQHNNGDGNSLHFSQRISHSFNVILQQPKKITANFYASSKVILVRVSFCNNPKNVLVFLHFSQCTLTWVLFSNIPRNTVENISHEHILSHHEEHQSLFNSRRDNPFKMFFKTSFAFLVNNVRLIVLKITFIQVKRNAFTQRSFAICKRCPRNFITVFVPVFM